MTRNRFRRGSGTYHCHNCKRLTRDVDSNASAMMCPECFAAVECENAMADNGETPQLLSEWQALLDGAEAKGGHPSRDKWWREVNE